MGERRQSSIRRCGGDSLEKVKEKEEISLNFLFLMLSYESTEYARCSTFDVRRLTINIKCLAASMRSWQFSLRQVT